MKSEFNASAVWRTATSCCLFVGALIALLVSAGVQAQEEDEFYSAFSGQLKLESRSFGDSGAYPGQARTFTGYVFEPSFYIEDARGWSFNIEAHLRHDDADSKRSKNDVREAYYLMFGEFADSEWEFRLGVDRVFWGVAELTNLVDVVNQTDAVDNPSGKIKMGQPMAHLTLLGDWGVAELFYLPGHRKRTYPGQHGRLRSSLAVDNEVATYEHSDGDSHADYAARYSLSAGSVDFGITVFDGTNREPSLRPGLNRQKSLVLVPHYEQIRQYGFDAGVSIGEYLLKFEAINRTGFSNLAQEKEEFNAFVIGGEYTAYSVFDSNADITVFAEWIHDDRNANATHSFQNDLFAAFRVALNDIASSEFVFSVIDDQDYNSRTASFEYSRRFTDQWSLKLETLHFVKSDALDLTQHPIRRDDYVDISLIYSF